MCIRSAVSMILRIGLVLILTASTFFYTHPFPVVQAEPSIQRSIQQDGLAHTFDENDPADPWDQTTEQQEPKLPPHLAERSEMARSKHFGTSNTDDLTVMSSFSCSTIVGIPVSECEALVSLYYSTNGSEWDDNSGWLVSNDPCPDWYGILCEDGHVSELYLIYNNLTGQLPAAISSLPYLTIIDLSGNSFSGPLPNEIGSLTQLEYFYFNTGSIQGGIPASIGSLTHLRELVLSSNNFSGTLPDEIGMLSELTRLDLSSNNFTGAIPSSIGGLVSLLEMDLMSCGLSGSLPAEIRNLNQLQTLILRNNQLSGSIPTFIGELQNLLVLDLSGNQFTGNLPDEIGLLTNLKRLTLWNNQLSGPLPASIDGLVELNTLGISSNQFSGELPPELFALSQLVHLDLNDNQFSGQLPEEIGELSLLTSLRIGKNQFTGTLPASLGNLRLITLEITDNNFTGSLPDVIDWDDMTSLTISRTNLSGPLPLIILNLPNLKYLTITGNQFSGQIPEILNSELRFRRIDLSGNQLSGEIPASLTDIWRLEELYLHTNALSGELPAGMWNMPRLEYLDLHSNQLEGQLPESAALPELRDLYLGSNQFTGGLPDAIWQLPKLSQIYLENNFLSGELSEEFWRHNQVSGLDLSDNQFTGHLPATFGMTRLSYLNLSSNQFIGDLPDTIGDSIWLRYLNLSNNLFTGLLPTSIGSLINLRTLDIHSNHFHGEIPYEITNLIQLNQPMWDYEPNGYTDIGHNHLTSLNPAVQSFLAEKDPDWETTQTPYTLKPIPSISYLDPSRVIPGSPGFSLKILGSNFVNGAVVYWNGEALVTTYHSSTFLSAAVPESKLAVESTARLTVGNPPPTLGPSAAVDFFISQTRITKTTRVSISSSGQQSNVWSGEPAISADGRYVAYISGNNKLDVFVHDRVNKTTKQVSLSSNGMQDIGDSLSPSLSADGRYIAFQSASTFGAGDPMGDYNIFVHDQVAKTTSPISISMTGKLAGGNSSTPSISADGRYIVFSSYADNLVVGDSNESYDIFVHDQITNAITRISVSDEGIEGNGASTAPTISADGRFISYASETTNIAPGASNGKNQILVYDRLTGTTENVSISSQGIQGNDESYFGSISGDGQSITFVSYASNLVTSDNNNNPDIFLHNRSTGETRLVSISTEKEPGNWQSGYPSISADGRLVVFVSYANNLVPNDTNHEEDIFVHHIETGVTERISVSSDGQEANSYSRYPAISGNGRVVAFESAATNLVVNDTNWTPDVFVRDRCIDNSCVPNIIINPKPVISSLNPSSILPGTTYDLTLLVNGKDFVEGAEIIWNGEKLSTQFISALKLQAIVPFSKLANNGVIAVYVDNPQPNSGSSEIYNFYISNLQPANGSTALSRRPLFQWTEATDATSYQVQIATVSNFSTLLMSLTSPTNTAIPTADLPLNKTIYWRVRAKVSGVYQTWSPRYSFTSANPPSNPVLVSPANNSLSTDYIPKLTWSQSSLPAGTIFEHYTLQFATDASFDPTFVVLEHAITDRTKPTYTLEPGLLQPNTKYFWRVRAANTIGHVSSWSASRGIRAAVLPPTLEAPVDASTALNPCPTFSWAAVDGASFYTIQISLYSNFSTLFLTASPTSTTYTPTKNLTQNKTIYWRVRANGTNGPSLWSMGSFKSANPPATPSLLSPANNALNTNYEPLLKWSASALPTGTTFRHYRLQVATDNAFKDLAFEKLVDGRTTPFYQVLAEDELKPNAKYFWRVQAENTLDHISTWSAVRSFRSAMLPTILTAPVEASTVLNRRPDFSWTAVDGATTYTIQLSLSASFGALITSAAPANTNWTATISLPQNKTIHWRVRANGPNGPSLWTKSYFTSANPPSTPSLVSPASNALNTNHVPLLKWGNSTLPTGTTFRHYRLQIATDNAFNDLIFEKLVDNHTTPFYQVVVDDALQPNIRYFWRVQSENTLDQMSTWSAVRSFRSAMLPPTVITPENGSTVTSRRPDFAWGLVDGATSYTIQLSYSATFGTLITSSSPISPAWKPSTNLPLNRTIHWRVRANGSNGPSPWSNASFQITE